MPIDYSRFPDEEARTPRDVFTARLAKICARLDEQQLRSIVDKDIYRFQQEASQVKALALWVVGSYARGALTCGDLDLVLETKLVAGPGIWSQSVKNAFIGGAAGVRVYDGVPEKNSSGVVFPEAVLVWRPGLSWKAALAAITPDPQAARFTRPGDEIPFRVEQLRGLEQDSRERLLQLRCENVFQWSFKPLSAIEPVDVTDETCRWFFEQSENKRKLGPIVMGYVQKLQTQSTVQLGVEPKMHDLCLVFGATCVYVEKLWMNLSEFDQLPVARIAFIPALGIRGPNGLWTIERGPKHPLVEAFKSATAWALAQADGVVDYIASSDMTGRRVLALELYETEEEAQEAADDWAHVSLDPRDQHAPYVPRLLSARDLLEVLACADVVDCKAGEFPLTRDGLEYCEAAFETARVLTPQELAAFLTGWKMVPPGAASA